MYKIKSSKANYSLNLPTKPEEITNEIIESLVSHIHVADNHAIVALRYKVNPFELVMGSKSQKKGVNVSVVPILASFRGTLHGTIGDRISIAGSDLERAIHLSNVSKISVDNVQSFLTGDEELSKNIVARKEFADVPYIYCLEFKIVGLSSIKAVIKDRGNKVDPFIIVE